MRQNVKAIHKIYKKMKIITIGVIYYITRTWFKTDCREKSEKHVRHKYVIPSDNDVLCRMRGDTQSISQ